MNEKIKELVDSLNELNDWLVKRQLRIKLTVIGRFAFYLNGLGELATTDIDTVTTLEDEVFDKILAIGYEHGIKAEWLNDNSEGIALPDGFEKRLLEKKDFSNIELKYASRIDLICLKAAAYLSRGEDDPKDFQDLLLLKPKETEIELAISFIRKNYSPPQPKFFPDFEERLDDLRSIYRKK
ncbi:MAG: DUF6036 family nucleotidyltransferase [Bacteriovoracia bacterium]